MFHAALKSARVEARASLHVGDHPLEDVDAARRVGFSSVWVKTGGQDWPVDLQPPSWTMDHVAELDVVLSSIEEVLS
jgi:putative hydrolase of the HAD superfamily